MHLRHGALLTLIIITIIGATAFMYNTNIAPVESTDVSQETTIQISTGATDDGDTPGYGLLNVWQKAYDGSSTSRNYRLNKSTPSTTITEECGNCHMEGWDDAGTVKKHEPPLHPIGLSSSDTGDWFYDDGLHRGPNTQLASQQAGITVSGSTVYCGDCHTPTNPSGFANSSNSGRSSDPHSVHRDVLTREGCIRCHSYNPTSFSGYSTTFTQDNATRTTYGIANPINMTRAWDGKFLSTPNEATYNSSLDTSGSGWNRYGSNDASNSTQYACGDCHDQFHKEGGLGFAFDDSASSRKGPYAPVKHSNSWGINSSGVIKTCGDCHVTDAHAVHTNGGINSKATHSQVWDASDQSIINSSVRGAELCDQCHSQNNAAGSERVHYATDVQEERGLAGSESSSHNRPPNLESGKAEATGDSVNPGPFGGGYYDPSYPEDCGFCHQ